MYFASYDDKEIARLGLSFNDIYFLEWFINWRQTSKMTELPDEKSSDKENHYYWLTYEKIIADLPALQIHNNTSINNMLNRLCGKGKNNYYEYPLMRQKVNINLINKAYFAIRPEVLAKMKGLEYSNGLFEKKDLVKLQPKEKKESICKLSPVVESILAELDKLHLSNGKKLFSYTLPTDHKIHTKSMKHFQDALYDLYEGRFLSRYKLKDHFLERNNSYITDETRKEINKCKGNWNQINMTIQCSAKNYMSWWEADRESLDKGWLTRDIGSFMFNSLGNTSMFYITILKKASKTREVIAENTFNRLPTFIQDKFIDFYNDDWDGLAYWNKIYSVYKWYKDNSDDLISENINYKYWLEDIGGFMQGYYNFINMLNVTKYLKHFGTGNPTWNWFINQKKQEHGIEE